MLPSVRRVASTSPGSPIISTFGSAVTRTVRTNATALLRPRHQRRCSSSKPSKDNGADDLPVGQPAQAAKETKSAEVKPSVEKRKRRAKDSSDKLKLPSVPSTQHLPGSALALSTFFSLHRPISVTNSLPRPITDDSFASIFATPTRQQKVKDNLATMQQAVQALEEPMSKLGMAAHQEPEHVDSLHKIDIRHPSGSEASVYVQVNAMSGHYHPFTPPPLPLPKSAAEMARAESDAEKAMLDAEAQADGESSRVYKAVFTIEESTDADGNVQILAHTPELIEQQPEEPRTFLERMALRQLKYEDAREERETQMVALSVKRQRKVKMKKKKYRKLLKNTRNERRKQDKL